MKRTKAERQAWWASLPAHVKAKIVEQCTASKSRKRAKPAQARTWETTDGGQSWRRVRGHNSGGA